MLDKILDLIRDSNLAFLVLYLRIFDPEGYEDLLEIAARDAAETEEQKCQK
jgi:hypothetical protein